MDDKFIPLTHSMIRRKDLTMQEKIIYLEILNLSSLEKGCIASNNHFEKCFDISKKSVSNTISNLVKKGFINSRLSDRNHTRVLSIKDGQVSIKDGQVSIKDGQVSIKDGESKENRQSNKPDNKPDKETTPKTPPRKKPLNFIYPEEFEELWKINRQGDKWNAYKAYYATKSNYTQEQLKQVLDLEAKKTFGRRHTSTVLNGDLDDALLEEQKEVDWSLIS